MLTGVNYLHGCGVVHRDLKLEKILLGPENEVKICGYGFSKAIHEGETAMETVIGSEEYMAPEIITRNYDGIKVDVFSCGVILFYLYCGFAPWRMANQHDPRYDLFVNSNDLFWQ